MRIYHGAILAVSKPDALHSRDYLDFGKGFYATSYYKQAARWARRKALRKGGLPVVSTYELSDDLTGLKILRFEDDETWVNFVCDCRRGSDAYKAYDIVIGNVANDDVYAAVDMYYRGLWDIQRTLKELTYYEMNNQYCFIKQKAIDDKLAFIESVEVSEDV
jgi:hypothetical protein